jgi:L-fucose isomerase-like protein
MEETFGVKIVYLSYKELNAGAARISDSEAEAMCADWEVPMRDVPRADYLTAVKLYIAVKAAIAEIGGVHGVGANCLNESFNSKTTPCLAWNMLFEKDGILWACEGDTVTLISKFIIYNALRRPVMMTNLYPFLVGMAALKHEKIDKFPDIPNSDNYSLGVHCGYFGFAPQSFCSKWELRPKVLEIVNENALMVDCEMPQGPATLAKIHTNMKSIIIIEAEIGGYAQYPGSDCRNGALIHFKNDNGHEIMQTLSSHHALIITGDCAHELKQMAQVYGFDTVVM